MTKAALYARVSTQLQEKEDTVRSQVDELKKYACEHDITYNESDIYIDDGYSGGSLIRPALDRLRDAVTEGGYNKILVYDPDRLARSYVYQMVLLEEINSNGCSVEFIRNPIGSTPDEQLLLQMQGMIAEYERAKIYERTRRGKQHRMQNGEIINGRKIFGYNYIKKTSYIPAHYKIIDKEAEIVRSLFNWFVEDKLTLREIAVRLNERCIKSPRGGKWQGPNMSSYLKNIIYTGTGYGNMFKAVEPKRRGALQDKYYKYSKTCTEKRPREEWFAFDSPRIISDEIFDLAQHQLKRNKQLAGRRTKNNYLLRGVIKCGECGLSMFGQKGKYQCPYSRPAYAKEHDREVCSNKQRIPTDDLDDQIWKEVFKLLKNKGRLKQIHKQLQQKVSPMVIGSIGTIEKKKEKLMQQLNRINDLYVLGDINKKDHRQKYSARKEELSAIEKQLKSANHDKLKDHEIEKMLTSFNKFCDTIHKKLDGADFTTKRYAVEEIVKSVEVKKNEIILNYAVPLKRKKGTLCMVNHQ